MMALLKQQQPLQPLGTVHRPPITTTTYPSSLTLTLVDHDLVAVSKPQQTAQYIGPAGPHSRMYCGFQIPISGKYTSFKLLFRIFKLYKKLILNKYI